jgi:inner membrane protein
MKTNFLKNLPNGNYGVKLIVIAILLICFAVPIRLVSQIVRERERRSSAVREEVIGSWGGRTSITGPYLIIPLRWMEPVMLEDGKEVQRLRTETAVFFPETLTAGTEAATEIRTRGIFNVPVFTTLTGMEGRFDLSALEEHLEGYTVDVGEIRIGINLGDLRGIRGIDTARLNGRDMVFEPSGGASAFGGYRITAPASLDKLSGGADYRFSIRLGGGGSISLVPVARQTEVTIRSGWTAPSFFGSALPTEHLITEDGFSASWSISHLSRSIPSFALEPDLQDARLEAAGFGVRFFQSDDPYPRNERSVKYAWLFLIVPFLTFFLFEVVRKRAIHPVQYLLAGSADIVFYLLLLSLSEHTPFMTAYAAAAGGVTLLLGGYGSTVLGGKREGTLLAAILAIAYAYLLVVLKSEDYALLLGSAGLFICLALVMYLTRGISWYQLPLASPPCKAGEADVQ